MDLGIRGKSALVTGSSSGLGKACALALAAEGVKLAVAARRKNELEQTAREALSKGAAAAEIFVSDLSAVGASEQLVSDVQKKFGGLDILVVNSGGPKPGTVTQMKLEDWDAAYKLLLRSMLALIEAALPVMREKHWGRIVALTSSSVKQPIPTLALSNVFRTALVSALKTLAGEVAQDGVTINAIATGRVLTDRLRSLYKDDQALAKAASEVPARRIAQPAEYAPLVAFLCGEPAGYVTGQTISIDGGLVAGLFG